MNLNLKEYYPYHSTLTRAKKQKKNICTVLKAFEKKNRNILSSYWVKVLKFQHCLDRIAKKIVSKFISYFRITIFSNFVLHHRILVQAIYFHLNSTKKTNFLVHSWIVIVRLGRRNKENISTLYHLPPQRPFSSPTSTEITKQNPTLSAYSLSPYL